MNYANIYATLIAKATKRIHPFDVDTEQHHILPLAEGGTDDPSNIAYLTVHEHLVAHTLLYKLGFEGQILDAQAILLDSLNRHHPRRYRHPKLHFKRWIRRAVARRSAALDRDWVRARQWLHCVGSEGRTGLSRLAMLIFSIFAGQQKSGDAAVPFRDQKYLGSTDVVAAQHQAIVGQCIDIGFDVVSVQVTPVALNVTSN
jgi:hypothetical protein